MSAYGKGQKILIIGSAHRFWLRVGEVIYIHPERNDRYYYTIRLGRAGRIAYVEASDVIGLPRVPGLRYLARVAVWGSWIAVLLRVQLPLAVQEGIWAIWLLYMGRTMLKRP